MVTQTQNAVDIFGAAPTPRRFVKALAQVKEAALRAVQKTDQRWPDTVFKKLLGTLAIIKDGGADEKFILPLYQGSAGTSLNMNMNEAIAELAGTPENPLDSIEDCNRYQSTNDVVSTAATVIAMEGVAAVEDAVITLQHTIAGLEKKHTATIITARTEMQSALPISLAQVFGSWAGMIERDRWRFNKVTERLRTTALGGTAVGTCFFAPRRYIFAAEKNLREITGLPLARSQNLTDEIAHLDKYAELASVYQLCADNVCKITDDFLLYTSSFAGEIKHPDLQYGSSIMPFKTNPVVLEFVKGLAISVRHTAGKIIEFVRSGQLQLNPFLPFIISDLLEIEQQLVKALTVFCEKFLNKMEIDVKQAERNLLASGALLNALRPVLGYNAVKHIGECMKQSTPADFGSFLQMVCARTDPDTCRKIRNFELADLVGPMEMLNE